MGAKKLYRSKADRVFAGVCGGIGEYFNIDPVIVRIIWVIVTLMGGAGILGYIIAWIVIPDAGAAGHENKSKGCLYAVLIVIFAGMALAFIGPVISLIIGIAATGINLILPSSPTIVGGYSPVGFAALLQVMFMAVSGLIAIAAIIVVIYLIRRGNNKNDN